MTIPFIGFFVFWGPFLLEFVKKGPSIFFFFETGLSR